MANTAGKTRVSEAPPRSRRPEDLISTKILSQIPETVDHVVGIFRSAMPVQFVQCALLSQMDFNKRY